MLRFTSIKKMERTRVNRLAPNGNGPNLNWLPLQKSILISYLIMLTFIKVFSVPNLIIENFPSSFHYDSFNLPVNNQDSSKRIYNLINNTFRMWSFLIRSTSHFLVEGHAACSLFLWFQQKQSQKFNESLISIRQRLFRLRFGNLRCAFASRRDMIQTVASWLMVVL